MSEKIMQSPIEEFWNSLTHFLGAFAALIGMGFLISLSVGQGAPLKVLSLTIYGAALVMMYGASTLYHMLTGDVKRLFQKFDHVNIYLFIAGTYTPVTLVSMEQTGFGHWIFFAIWGLALTGIFLEFSSLDNSRKLSVVIHVIMGWLIVIAIKPLMDSIPYKGFLLLLYGGLTYTGGILFYVMGKRVRYFHVIWHLFALVGSTFHYFFMLFYVV